MSHEELRINTQENDPTWECALELVRNTLDIPSVLPPLVKNSWAGIYETKDFMHGMGFPGSSPRALMRAAEVASDTAQETPADVARAVSILGVQYSSVVVAINFVCRAALLQRPPEALWAPLFRDMMTAIEVGYHFGCRAADIGAAGGALMGFSRTAGRSVLLAHDVKRFSHWCSSESGDVSRRKALELFGCEPYQVGALTIQQLGFGPEMALAVALASGHLHHELIEVVPTVSRWKAAFHWIDALQRGAPFPDDSESRIAFHHLLQAAGPGEPTDSRTDLHTQLAQLARNSSSWLWHLPKGSYEETAAHLASPPQATIKGKVWKTNKREIIFEGRDS
jgi:hypothetical protein